ncbi:hypothetical protein Tco_0706655 [Tanacetum coccineum]|uniref:Uncharacterized protein n=1 Tax=Tanacetum coccineum TaxID=301880 RepID=A0ABQ4Y805_9ASTR
MSILPMRRVSNNAKQRKSTARVLTQLDWHQYLSVERCLLISVESSQVKLHVYSLVLCAESSEVSMPVPVLGEKLRLWTLRFRVERRSRDRRREGG